ncbi:MAG: N-acetyltransferase [Pseudomonadota bacterium]
MLKDKVPISVGQDGQALATLKAKAFPFASVAPRAADVLRAGARPISGGAFSALHGACLVGSVALWPILLRTSTQSVPLTLLGPLMVDPDRQGSGLGSQLMATALDFADAQALPPVMLVGDMGYYERFGFSNALTQQWTLPGVAAAERVLLRQAPHAQAPLTAMAAQVLPAFAPPCGKQAAA